MEKLKSGDRLLCYYLAGGGFTAWMIERGGSLMFNAITPSGGWTMHQWPAGKEAGWIGHGIGASLKMLGFTEFSVYRTLDDKGLSADRDVLALSEQFKIHEKEMERVEKSRHASDLKKFKERTDTTPANEDALSEGK